MRTYASRRVSAGVLVLLVAAGTLPASGQGNKKAPPENSSNTTELNATTTATVKHCVRAEAVLLSKPLASALFGGFVGENYAVVKTTVSNRCDNQQFILHDIYFDYSKWSLSGIFGDLQGKTEADANAQITIAETHGNEVGKDPSVGGGADARKSDYAKAGTAKPDTSTESDDEAASTRPGEVATVGALDVQDQDAADAIWSPRNSVVKAVTLLGEVASGYAFLWSGGAAKGIGAYNSGFVENLASLWPDRRIDQEKNILSLGYRTDRTTAVAKDDHGSYYAFFPLKVFLSPTLVKIFLNSPAVFLSSPQVLLDEWLKKSKKSAVERDSNTRFSQNDKNAIVNMLLDLSDKVDEQLKMLYPLTDPPSCPECLPNPTDPEAQKGKVARLLVDLSTPCPGESCPLDLTDKNAKNYSYQNYLYHRILFEKYLIKGASLHSVRIVVRGVMTVSLDAVPPIIESIAFNNEKIGAALWTVSETPAAKPVAAAAKPAGAKQAADAAPAAAAGAAVGTSAKCTPADSPKTLTGTISGKFLVGGTPSIEALTFPFATKATDNLNCYIGSVTADPLKSSDTSLPFSMQLANSLPAGSKLSFIVSRNVDSTGYTDGGSDGSKKLSSTKYDYTVQYDGPQITEVAISEGNVGATWKPGAKLTGTVTGTNLVGGTVAVKSLLNDSVSEVPADYLGTPNTTQDSATKLNFSFQLTKTQIPASSKLTFVVNTKSTSSNTTGSNQYEYSVPADVPKAAAPKAAAPPAKQAAKRKKTKHSRKTDD